MKRNWMVISQSSSSGIVTCLHNKLSMKAYKQLKMLFKKYLISFIIIIIPTCQHYPQHHRRRETFGRPHQTQSQSQWYRYHRTINEQHRHCTERLPKTFAADGKEKHYIINSIRYMMLNMMLLCIWHSCIHYDVLVRLHPLIPSVSGISVVLCSTPLLHVWNILCNRRLNTSEVKW